MGKFLETLSLPRLNFEEIENERLNSRCAKQRSRPEILKCIVLEKLILSFSLWTLGEFDTFFCL